MIKYFIALLAAAALWFAAGSVEASNVDGVCWKTVPCSGVNPCVYVREQPFYCGTDCVVLTGSGQRGAPGCMLAIVGNCLQATLVQPGCCVTPCPPPAENCPIS